MMAKGTDIVLIQPPVWGVFDPPTALAQISACMKNAGARVRVCDLNIELFRSRSGTYQDAWAIERSSFWTNENNVSVFFADNKAFVEEYISAIAALRPKLVGLSVNVCSLHSARQIARRIREISPETVVAAGGPLFCVPFDAEYLLGGGEFDVVVAGEGEETFVELAASISSGIDISSCRGICFMRGGSVVKTGQRPPIKVLDALPFLDLRSFPAEKYDPPGHLGRHISLMTSRGCVQGCIFCGPKAYWQGFRTMSGKRIYDEIKYHLGCIKDIERVEFLDLLMNGSMKTLDELCSLLIKDGPAGRIKWRANLIIRPEMTAEVFSKMRKAGCEHVTFGIESGSQRVLDLMRKRYRVSDADKALKGAHESGIKVTCNFMFGFPGETKEDFEETKGFLERNSKNIDTAYPSRTYFTIEPHSYVESHLAEFGIVPDSTHGQYWESVDGSNNYPERLRRCEDFCARAAVLGVNIGSGLQTSAEMDKWLNLGNFHEIKGNIGDALKCFEKYLALDPDNATVIRKTEAIKDRSIKLR